MNFSRLDILIYCHDGRGLGHASRSIAIGLAVRRLYPNLRVLFLSGSPAAGKLIHDGQLDWIKLPAYRTRLQEGKSIGIHGYSMFSDKELGILRAKQIAEIVALYRPRVILSDHSPQGKHKELLPALEACTRKRHSEESSSTWVLGVRGIVGNVPQIKSYLPGEIFRQYYTHLLWYGDSTVLGQEHLHTLQEQFGTCPLEMGYVSRLHELESLYLACENPGEPVKTTTPRKLAGTISLPWLSPASTGKHGVINAIIEAIARLGKTVVSLYGPWHIYMDLHSEYLSPEQVQGLEGLQKQGYCLLRQPGAAYNSSVVHSQTALIYGGYNSLVDVLHVNIPATVILRDVQDQEQQIHVQLLQKRHPLCILFEEQVNPDSLTQALSQPLQQTTRKTTKTDTHMINLGGAEQAARQLVRIMKE